MPTYFSRGIIADDGTVLNAPAADGTADQVMTTDGSGQLVFADAASGGSGSVISAVKAADTSRNSTTTVSADPDLVIAVEPDTVYQFILTLRYSANTGSNDGFRYTFTGPTGSTLSFNAAGSFEGNELNGGDEDVLQTAVNGNVSRIGLVVGTIQVAGTAGNLSFAWAQGVSNANDHKAKAGSVLTLLEAA